MMEIKGIFKKSEKIVSRKVADEFILVPLCRTTKELDSFYALNEVAARVWELIDGKTSLDKIISQIMDEFDVDKKTAQSDINELMSRLADLNAIKKTG